MRARALLEVFGAAPCCVAAGLLAACGPTTKDDVRVAAAAPTAIAPGGPVLGAAAAVFAPAGTRLTWAESANGEPRGGTMTVAAQDGQIARYTNQRGETRSMLMACRACGVGVTEVPDGYAALWPLAVGNRATFEVPTPRGKSAFTSAVVATERLSLPGGAVDTFVIDTTGSGGLQSRSWFAPSVGWIVKVDERTAGGYRYTGDVVAIARN